MFSSGICPAFRVIYQGVDITAGITPCLTGVCYTDKWHGESEAVLSLHNADGRWFEAWAPEDGDMFELWYGYAQQEAWMGFLPKGKAKETQVYARQFTVDEWSICVDSSGERVEIRGLSTPVTAGLRIQNTVAYEKLSLSEIVQKIAARHGLRVEDEIEDLSLERVTQYGEKDLSFVRWLAEDYGHYFIVRGDTGFYDPGWFACP